MGKTVEAKVVPIVGNKDGNVSTVQIPLKAIKRNTAMNSRQTTGLDKDSMVEFAESIRVNGLLSPVVVRPITDTKGGFAFDLIAGFRRTEAAKMLGWTTIPAIVKAAGTDEKEARVLNYVENVHRGDLSAFEKAHSLVGMVEIGIPQKELIARLQLRQAQSTVDNLIRVYRELDPKLKEDWGNPKSKVRPYLSMANLFEIIKHPIQGKTPEEVTQEGCLLHLMHESNPAAMEAKAAAIAAGKSGAGKTKGAGTAASESPTLRVKRADIQAIMGKLETAELSEDAMMGYTMAFDFVLGRHKGKLMNVDGKSVLWAPEKKAKSSKAHGNKGKKKAE